MAVQEKLKGILGNVKERWMALGKKIKIAIGAGAVVAVVLIAVLVSMGLNRPYVTLFTDLNSNDMGAMVSYLTENGITGYKIEGEDTILATEDQADALRAALIQAGYLNSGFAYSTYLDNVSSLTTESERNTLLRFEIQDRTAATIRQFVGVKDAIVEISPGQNNSFILDSSNVVEASAHVTVVMYDGMEVTDDLAKSIRTLISHSIEGLDITNVSISDQYGNLYSDQDSYADIADVSELKQKLEEETNNKIRTSVMQVLIPLFGIDNVRVGVNSVVDVDRTYTDSTDYSLEEGATEGIIGKRIYDQKIIRGDEAANGGVVGTQENSDFNTYVETPMETDGNETLVSSKGEDNMLVDTTKKQVEHLAGTVTDVMVSVTINQNTIGETNLADLYDHVARAAGIGVDQQDDKISILVSPFYTDTATGGDETVAGVPMWVIYAAAAGLGVFVLLLVLILVLRSRSKKKKQQQLEAEQAAAQQEAEAAAAANLAAVLAAGEAASADGSQGADIMEMETEKSMELRKLVRRFAEENPEIAAQMVKTWLRESEE